MNPEPNTRGPYVEYLNYAAMYGMDDFDIHWPAFMTENKWRS